jgi:lysophospholipase L1-like esterase
LLSSVPLCFLKIAAVAGDAGAAIDPAAYDHPVRVACVGDSITFGVGTADPAHESYPAQLQQLLGPHWQVVNFGVGGRTLLRKQDPLDLRPALDFRPDVAVIMLGTNDSRQATWDRHGAEFTGDYTGIIAEFRALDSHPRVWICAPIPLFPGQWGLSESLLVGATIPAIRSVAAATGTPLIDLHTALLDAKADCLDQVHPNAHGAHRIADVVAATLTGHEVPAAAPQPR